MRSKLGMNVEKSSMFGGSDGLTEAQRNAQKLGIGHKRQAKETTIFQELNAMQNALVSDDDDPYALPAQPRDMAQRKHYSTLDDEEHALQGAAAASSAAGSVAGSKRMVSKRPATRKRAIVDEDSDESQASEESSAWGPGESSEAFVPGDEAFVPGDDDSI